MEGGVVYRNTKDYIQRNIQDLSGGKEGATYTNYGKVGVKVWIYKGEVLPTKANKEGGAK